jgi:hypothetical protein
MRLGWFGIRRRTVTAFQLVADGYRYNIAFAARGRERISNIPIVDRPEIIDALLRLHDRTGNARNYQAHLFNAEGRELGLLDLTINPEVTTPAPLGQILYGSQ